MFRRYDREKVSDEEERIRDEVRTLSDDQRAVFYKTADKELKDPDTYAVLNWMFLSGLHHFYLKKNFQGGLNLALSIFSLVLIFSFSKIFVIFGILLFFTLGLVELPDMFRSQVIVQDYNNQVMKGILRSGKLSRTY
ncbi:conserved hypothetical protein [Denitrovibrio acetiphilus DSM 12809]|uniref:TM2 domain containing protein n=1 Tax=Denitrovibrio acetiphilus (strain DSM 12809 / NBRC 114555 / N2460) TaxID=522772 RepID=D4H7R1_DENA2|nr:hypothetical protein [Denitrovibrio acetiphilus]ADD68060.1 conserved hypothetical protein [Denitrovibrio acetiphilus DSM 12809]